MSEKSGRLVENVLALLGALVLSLSAVAGPLRDLGVQLGPCTGASTRAFPWESAILGVVCVMPKTISRGTASNFVGAVANRVGGLATRTMQTLRRPPQGGPT